MSDQGASSAGRVAHPLRSAEGAPLRSAWFRGKALSKSCGGRFILGVLAVPAGEGGELKQHCLNVVRAT